MIRPALVVIAALALLTVYQYQQLSEADDRLIEAHRTIAQKTQENELLSAFIHTIVEDRKEAREVLLP